MAVACAMKILFAEERSSRGGASDTSPIGVQFKHHCWDRPGWWKIAIGSANWRAPIPSVPDKIPPTNVLIRFAMEVGSCMFLHTNTIIYNTCYTNIYKHHVTSWSARLVANITFASHTISRFFHASLLRQRFFQRCRVLLPQHPYPKSCSSQTWPREISHCFSMFFKIIRIRTSMVAVGRHGQGVASLVKYG